MTRTLALYRKTVAENPWIAGLGYKPHPAQQRFLLHFDTRELFYGGAGGGGKSMALWFGALQYVDTPGYAALLLRRTYAELSLPKSLMARSREYLANTDADWNEQRKTWTFPSGATITFGYLEKDADRFRYASAEFAYIGFDELTGFSENSYRFLFTRLRRPTGLDVPLRMRSASNPGGPGHDFARKRFVEPKTRASGAVFIPARLDDNPSLDRDEYVASLAQVDPTTRAQILAGDWDAYEGGRFKREWFKTYTLKRGGPHGSGEYHLQGGRFYLPSDCWVFCTCDPAASSEETAKTADPDYTVISTWAVTPRNDLLWLNCHRFRLETPDIVPQIQSEYSLYRPLFVGIEAVAANRAVFQLARRTTMNVKELAPGGKDKLVRATPAMVLAEAGRLYLPESAPWLEDALSELLRFTGDSKKDSHDDVVDCLAWGVICMEEYGGDSEGLPLVLGERPRR